MHGEKINDGLIFWGLRLELEVEQSDVGYLTVTFKSFENAVFGATNLETEKTVLKHWKRMISEGTLTLLDDGTCTIPAEVLVNNMIKPAWFAVRDCIERYPNGFTLRNVMDFGAPNMHSARRVLDKLCSKGSLKKTKGKAIIFKPVCEG